MSNRTNPLREWERKYLATLMELRSRQKAGHWRGNRTGVRTAGIFGHTLEVPLNRQIFPAMVTKAVHLKSVVAELLWFLSGETNVKPLQEMGCKIWNEWADENGDLGPVYGAQWRNWPAGDHYVDQISKLLEDLKERPDSRRMIVSAWNPAVLPLDRLSPQENASMGRQALAPCHMLFQVYVEDLLAQQRLDLAEGIIPEGLRTQAEYSMMKPEEVHDMLDRYNIPTRGLSLRVDQRSADWFLGVPFNIASYALLAHLLAQKIPGMAATRLIMQFGDVHLYENHAEQADEQLARLNEIYQSHEPGDLGLAYPALSLRNLLASKRIELTAMEDITFDGYQSMKNIAAPVAV